MLTLHNRLNNEGNRFPMAREANSATNGAALSRKALDGLSRSLKPRWKCYRKQLDKSRRKMSKRAVHDARVEARRVLSVLDLLAPFLPQRRLARAQRALKCHLDTFDDLRDIHVQLAAVAQISKDARAARQFYRFLEKRECRLRRWTCKRAKRLREKSLSRLVAACRDDAKGWLKNAGPAKASTILLSVLSRAFAAVEKFKDRIDAKEPRTIHCTRIAFKRYRYMVEALADQLPWANERFLEAMHQYQGLMGDIQDAEVLRKTYQKFVKKHKPEAQPSLKLSNQLLRRRKQFIRRYVTAADRLETFKPPGAAGRAARNKTSNVSRA